MNPRRNHLIVLAVLAALAVVLAPGCGKKDEGKDKKAPAADKKDPAAAEPAAKKAEPKPAKMVEMALPMNKFTIQVPEGTKIEEGIVAGSDAVDFPGVSASMLVRPFLLTDKPLDQLEPWAKGHQIQKFKKEIMKEGSDKTHVYMYEVDMAGRPAVVYHHAFQQNGKDYKCFANAPNEAAARTMKKACDTIKPAEAAAAEPE